MALWNTADRVWPDVTAVVIDALSTAWGGTVVGRVPPERPAEFVVVMRSGGRIDGALDRAQMDIDIWSGDPNGSAATVWATATTIREHLRTLPAGDSPIVDYVEDSAGYLPDPESQTPRVIVTATITTKPTDA